MSTNNDIARAILDAGAYVVLATADADGVPWASPVWFAQDESGTIFWVSYPGARHSRNIQAQPRIAMVVFDSTVEPLTGQAVYMTAYAAQLADLEEVAHAVDVFSRESVRQGMSALSLDDVTGTARLRIYRARIEEYSILDPDSPYDVRVQVQPFEPGDG